MIFNKQKIFDYLEGKLSTLETKQIEAWYSNPTNEELFYTWLDEWERSRLIYTPDEERLSDKRQFIISGRDRSGRDRSDLSGSPEGPQTGVDLPVKRMRFFRTYNFGTAAVLVCLMAVGFFLTYENILTQEYETRAGETRTLRLADGSRVTLNAGTILKVPRFGFGRNTREVTLQGEALFSVVSTEDRKRFIVKTSNAADVIVLGTEFSVFSRSDSTHVKLNHGKVLLRYRNEDSRLSELDMRPGDQVALNASGRVTVEEAKTEIAVQEWAIQEFRFEKTSLKEIVRMLNDSYGMEVRLQNDEMGTLSMTGTYEVYRGKELLEIAAEVLGLGIHYDRDKYILVSKTD